MRTGNDISRLNTESAPKDGAASVQSRFSFFHLQFPFFVILLLLASASPSLAGGTNAPALDSSLPNTGLSLLRVSGALALVLGLFLGGVWLFRNWQRLVLQKGRAPKLNILEVRSLGQRQALYVVAFEQQRFLLASSPAGVNLLSHLPVADEATNDATALATAPVSFGQVLQQVLARK